MSATPATNPHTNARHEEANKDSIARTTEHPNIMPAATEMQAPMCISVIFPTNEIGNEPSAEVPAHNKARKTKGRPSIVPIKINDRSEFLDNCC
mmetsp:Transcript_110994/g.173609  ORF Transcript_110994/g.173609 Transcript_110994/m.173609 type:complete len:94 (-) Transcript_110994:75-356(-)